MAEATIPDVWTTASPEVWPGISEPLTISTLQEIEACPRRWALSSATYPRIWNGRGYPPQVQMSAIAGTVVHSALQSVVSALVSAGCSSLQDASAVRVMKDLGGYSKLLQGCIDRVLQRYSVNPRASSRLEEARRTLSARLGELRLRVQTLLSGVELPTGVQTNEKSGHDRGQGALGNGVYAEIQLRARALGWKGKADLLLLSESSCEIVDFKTGEDDPQHAFQLQVYALLWKLDRDLNPSSRSVTKLTVEYGDHQVHVPAPGAPHLRTLQEDLRQRTEVARQTVGELPPPAKPSRETCRWCDVRHLCDEYWKPETQASLNAAPNNILPLVDAELVVVDRLAASSWEAVVRVCGNAARDEHVVLRWQQPRKCPTKTVLLGRGRWRE